MRRGPVFYLEQIRCSRLVLPGAAGEGLDMEPKRDSQPQDVAEHLSADALIDAERAALQRSRAALDLVLVQRAQLAAQMVTDEKRKKRLRYETMRKRQSVGLILTFFFGPLGLLYSGPLTALAFMILSAITLGVGLVILWPMSMIMSVFYISGHNDNVAKSV